MTNHQIAMQKWWDKQPVKEYKCKLCKKVLKSRNPTGKHYCGIKCHTQFFKKDILRLTKKMTKYYLP